MELEATTHQGLPRVPAGPAQIEAFRAFLDGLDAALLALEQGLLGGGRPIGPEAPVGVVNGVNRTFSLSEAPLYLTSHLQLGGWWLVEGVHFTVAGDVLTYAPGFAPQVGESHAIAFLA